MHRPAWTLVALSAAALALGACSDSTRPSDQLTDAERATLISTFDRMGDTLSTESGNFGAALKDIALAIGTNSDVSVTTVSSASLIASRPGVSAIATAAPTLSGSFRVIGLRDVEQTDSLGDTVVVSGLVAWQDTSTVVVALKFGDAPVSFDSTSSTNALFAGVYLAPWAMWQATSGLITAAPKTMGATCTSNPAPAMGFDATCNYMTMTVGVDIDASAPASSSRNTASGSATAHIAPLEVHGVNFYVPYGSRARRTMF